ncbi:MAG: hypothetical protein GY906_35230 [bacterium]|nr:hypothetical protein [bacterium]
MTVEKILRPDSKGRICLGQLARGVSSFHLTVDEGHRIVLVPYSEIPLREKWLFNNQDALASVKRGLEASEPGQLSSRGIFSQFADEVDD